MLKNQFIETNKLILNYFVPFSNGKFIATCLMFSKSVEPMVPLDKLAQRLSQGTSWNNIEYSDIDFWWKDHSINWFNNQDWFDNLTDTALTAISENRYCFYTCHEDYTVKHLKNKFVNANTLMVLPNFELCKQNYKLKNWLVTEPEFETSRVYQEFLNFKPVDTELVFDQTHIFDKKLFIDGITNIANLLSIELDINQVLEYRNQYLNNKFNKI